ncbi:Cyclin-dependent protein kinase inhibitor SMR6 [Linum perenne]
MGFPKKKMADSGLESEGKKWVIAGISIKSLKPINTKPRGRASDGGDNTGEEKERSTTPTAKEARIPEKLQCPPAPRKRRPSSRCNYTVAREFFTPPDLDSVFKCYVEKAN